MMIAMGGTMTARGALVVLVGWAMGACATGGEPEVSGQVYDGPGPGEGTTNTTMSTSASGQEDEGSEDPGIPPTMDGLGPPDLGMCNDDTDCFLPAGSCLEQQGHCEGGMCEHGAAELGLGCDDGELCTTDDTCDGEGVCLGIEIVCTAPNAEGGQCVDGLCEGLDCAADWADCNDDMNDGCEVALGTATDCGGCGDACSGADNADAMCTGGSCEYLCQGSWENCDGDWGNGCEIPVGVAHQCDSSGINPGNGCWTAYCGASADPEATNFGSFHCIDCSTCRSPAAGQCQWCDHDSGVFFPAETCGCGGYEDLSCS